MRFEELNWFDVESYLEQEDRLMIVLGACEQHAYLSLQTDVRIPLALADAASQESGVLVAPALNFGASPYFLAYPGTISLRLSTLLDVVEDMVRSVYGYGFRRILILNGHGGNEPVRGRLYELATALPGLRLSWYAWWMSHSVTTVAQARGLKSYHAGWIEAFPFVRVADLPDGEKLPPRVPGMMGASEARQVFGDGMFGGPYQVEEDVLDEVWQAAREDVLQMLQFDA
jgi:creatinine amidohydrolase